MLLVRRLAPVHHAVLHHRFTGFQLLPVGAAHGTGELVIDRADQGAHGAVVVDGIPIEVARFNVECAVVACFDVVRLQLLALRLDDARRFFLGVCIDGGSLAEGVLRLALFVDIAPAVVTAEVDTDRKFNRMRPRMARVLGLETRSAKEG